MIVGDASRTLEKETIALAVALVEFEGENPGWWYNGTPPS